MPRSLPDYLEDVRRELRRAATARGMAWTIVAIIAGLLLAGGIDFFTRSEAAPSRWLLSLLAFLPGVAVGGVFVLWPWAARMAPLELARRIEHADPSWRGILSSATAFHEPRSEYGSRPLQRHTLEIAESRIATESGPGLVDWVLVRRAAMFALGTVLVAVLVFALAPRSSSVALARLTRPSVEIEWPRRVELEMLDASGRRLPDPVNISQGQTYRFFVRNARGGLPADLALEIQGSGGRLRRELLPTAEEAPPGIEADRVGVASLFASEGTLRFRVTGGDDQRTEFSTARVVIPPRLEDLVVTVEPPAYLNAQPVTAPSGVARVRGVLGSRVTIHARANNPLASAALFVGDQPGPRPEIRADDRELFAIFMLANERPSSYWFRLTDTSGYENPQAPRYEISTQIDAPPEAVLDEPSADLTATPSAILPVAARATDDHGLTAVRLRFGRGTRLPDSQSTDLARDSQTIPLMEGVGRPQDHEQELNWPLEALGLAVGDQLTFRAEAADAYDLGPPRVGTSSPVTVTIVAPESKRDELLDRQTALLSELSEALRATFRLLDAINSLTGDLAAANELRTTHHDQLARAELEQQRLTEHLVGENDSSETAAAGMLAEFTANGIDDDALRTRLENITDELADLRDDPLAASTRHMTAARKASRADSAADALRAAGRDLNVVQDGLEALLDELGAWRNRRDVLAEIRDLHDSQQALAEETAQTAGQTLGTDADQLTPEQSSQLGSLGSRQAGVAERLDRLTTQLEALGDSAAPQENPRPDELSPDEVNEDEVNEDEVNKDEVNGHEVNKKNQEDEENAEPSAEGDPLLREAADRLQSSGLATTARSAGEAIGANRLGEAGRLQSEILAELGGLQDTLAEQQPAAADGEQLERMNKELKELADQQEALLETLRKRGSEEQGMTPDERDALREAQAGLRKTTASASRRARGAGAGQASDALTKASAAMSQGLERLRREQDRDAEQALAAALESLRETQAHVQEEAGQREAQLADTIPASMIEQVRVLAERQAGINQEVVRLESLKTEGGSLSRSQLLTLRETRAVQLALADETATVREGAPDAMVIQFVLDSAVKYMRQAAEGLDERDTGRQTQQSGTRALARIQEIVDAIETAGKAAATPGGNAGGSAEQDSRASGAVSQLAQLELLRVLQLDLQRRTKELEAGRGEEPPTSEEQQAVEAIGREVAAIRELVSALLPEIPVEKASGP